MTLAPLVTCWVQFDIVLTVHPCFQYMGGVRREAAKRQLIKNICPAMEVTMYLYPSLDELIR